MPDRVSAVVVTFNRRRLLEACVRSVLEQTHPVDRLYVVDNASSDGTAEWVKGLARESQIPVTLIRLPENRGGAGGFAAGLERSRDDDVEWVWVMDDDAVPEPDALGRLLEASPAHQEATVCLAPKVVYARGGIDANQRGHFRGRLRSLPEAEYRAGHYPQIGYMSFVGTLMRVSAVRAIELPRADFFVWGDDIEYSLRIGRLGQIRLVSESVMVHHRGSQSHTNRRSRLLARLTPLKLYPTPIEGFWQNLCGLRNYIWMKREYEGQSAFSAAGTTAQFLAKHLLIDDHPVQRARWIVRFARDGREGRFRNIPPGEWRELIRQGRL